MVNHHLTQLQQQYDRCLNDLHEQGSSCPPSLFPLDQRNEQLKDLVRLQQKTWSHRMMMRLKQFEAVIEERNLYDQLDLVHLTEHEVSDR